MPRAATADAAQKSLPATPDTDESDLIELDPEVIVLGGMIATSGDMLLEAIRLECARRLGPAQAEHLRIVLSPLGHDAAAIGAARLASEPR